MGMNSVKKAYRQSRPFFEGRRRHSPSYRRAVAQWNEIERAFNRIGGEPARDVYKRQALSQAITRMRRWR